MTPFPSPLSRPSGAGVASNTEEPKSEIPGIKEWRNKGNGFYVYQVHYTASEEKRGKEWYNKNRPLLPVNEWNREMEIDWSSFVGNPVFQNDWDPERMVKKIELDPKELLLRVWDFGYHHPAVAWGQISRGWQLRILQSDMGEDVDFRIYARKILSLTASFFPARKVFDACDRAGNFKKSVEGSEEVSILCNEFNIIPRYRYMYVEDSIKALRRVMNQSQGAEPGLIINDVPSNQTLIQAFKGGYHYGEKKEGKAEKEIPVSDGYFENAMDPVRYMNDNFMGLIGSWDQDMEKMAFGGLIPEKEDYIL
jgi:hypothetical protein